MEDDHRPSASRSAAHRGAGPKAYVEEPAPLGAVPLRRAGGAASGTWRSARARPPREESEPDVPENLPPPRAWRYLAHEDGFRHGARWRTFPQREVSTSRLQGRLVSTENLERLLQEMRGDISHWPTINVATAWHRLAKFSALKKKNADVQRQINDAAKRLAAAMEFLNPEDFSPRELANIVWAWGSLRFKSKRLLAGVAQMALQRLDEFNAIDVSNTLHGMAVLEFKDERLLEAFSESASERLDEYQPQEIANTVYSLAKFKHRHYGLLQAVVRNMSERLEDFKAQEISNTVYGMFLLEFRDEQFLKTLSEHIPRRLLQFNPQNIANTLYAFAQFRFSSRSFAEAVSLHVPTRLKELKRAKVINNILRSLTELQELGGSVT